MSGIGNILQPGGTQGTQQGGQQSGPQGPGGSGGTPQTGGNQAANQPPPSSQSNPGQSGGGQSGGGQSGTGQSGTGQSGTSQSGAGQSGANAQASSTSAPSTTVTTATVRSLPPALANQPGGTVVQGTVQGQAANGDLVVRTNYGAVRLATTANPPPGSTVSLQLPSSPAQATVQVSFTAQASGPGITPQAVPTGAAPAGTPAAFTPGSVLNALLTPRAEVPQAQGGVPQAPGALGSGAGGGTSGLAATVGALGSGPAGQAVSVRVVSVHLPGAVDAANQAASQAARSTSGATILGGTVTGTNAQGQPTLTTPLGTLTLNSNAQLQFGSRVNLEIINLPRPGGPPTTAPAQTAQTLFRAYPELSSLLQAGRGAEAGANAAAQALGGIPQAGPTLSTGIVFFLAAMRFGDMRNIFGQPQRAGVERLGQGDLLRGLGERFAQFGRLASEPGTGDWRAFPVPLMNGHAVEQITLYVRNNGGGQGGDRENGDKQTRFVVEFNLSKFGEVQIDGLVQQRRFDLMVRTHDALPPGVQERIVTIFTEANEISGFQGTVHFQHMSKFPVAPLEELSRQRGKVI